MTTLDITNTKENEKVVSSSQQEKELKKVLGDDVFATLTE
jgi:hypothetical protein